MNIPLLEALEAKFTEVPQSVDMTSWAKPADPSDHEVPCGTIGCIAGHAVVLSQGRSAALRLNGMQVEPEAPINPDGTLDFRELLLRSMESPVPSLARELLDLTKEQAMRLFFLSEWPGSFQREYRSRAYRPHPSDENDEEEDSKGTVTARRIRHFIDTAGAQ